VQSLPYLSTIADYAERTPDTVAGWKDMGRKVEVKYVVRMVEKSQVTGEDAVRLDALRRTIHRIVEAADHTVPLVSTPPRQGSPMQLAIEAQRPEPFNFAEMFFMQERIT
jgi:hypothetical protein